MTSIAVIILNWNGASLLRQFLPSVINNSRLADAQIWVADNGSTDDSVDILKNEFPEVKYLVFDRNFGYAGGYNKAMQQIECKYAMLLNSDVEVTENWLVPLLNLMESDSNIAACMPKLREFKRKDYFEYAGACGGFIDKYGYAFCRGRLFNDMELDSGQYDNTTSVFWASGAAFMVRRDLFIAEKGFDEDFFAHMEEIDLCWRLKNKGFRIMVEPASVVYHVGAATLSQSNPFKTYLNFRNNLLMMHKNLPAEKIISVMFRRKILDGIAAALMLVKFDFKGFSAVLKAHRDFKRMCRSSFNAKRAELLPLVSANNHPEIINKNIVVLHFLKRYRKYSDLV